MECFIKVYNMILLPLIDEDIPQIFSRGSFSPGNKIFVGGHGGVIHNVLIFNDDKNCIYCGQASALGMTGSYSGTEITFDNVISIAQDDGSFLSNFLGKGRNAFVLAVNDGLTTTGKLAILTDVTGRFSYVIGPADLPTLDVAGNDITSSEPASSGGGSSSSRLEDSYLIKIAHTGAGATFSTFPADVPITFGDGGGVEVTLQDPGWMGTPTGRKVIFEVEDANLYHLDCGAVPNNASTTANARWFAGQQPFIIRESAGSANFALSFMNVLSGVASQYHPYTFWLDVMVYKFAA
jgi:hypothetical protein